MLENLYGDREVSLTNNDDELMTAIIVVMKIMWRRMRRR